MAFDARMGEVYWGVFRCEAGLPVLLSEERVCPPDAVTLPPDAGGNWYGAGQGWTLKEQMPGELVERLAAIDDTLLPAAAQVAKLAEQGMSNGQAVPADDRLLFRGVRSEACWLTGFRLQTRSSGCPGKPGDDLRLHALAR